MYIDLANRKLIPTSGNFSSELSEDFSRTFCVHIHPRMPSSSHYNAMQCYHYPLLHCRPVESSHFHAVPCHTNRNKYCPICCNYLLALSYGRFTVAAYGICSCACMCRLYNNKPHACTDRHRDRDCEKDSHVLQ